MNRNEFFNTLFANLPQYTKEEQDEIRTYYDELISDGIEAGLDEAEVISKLDTPENIAHSLNAEYGKIVNVAKIQSSDAVTDLPEEKPENINHIVSDKQSSSDYTSTQPIHNVVLSARNRGFSVGVSEDEQVHVYCEQDEWDEIICYEKEGTFFFAQNNRKNLRFFFGFNSRVCSNITVKLPKSVLQAEVTTTNSSIHMTSGLTLDVLRAQTKNSSISCQKMMCGQLELMTTNAGIKCEQVNAQNIQLTTSNASVKLKEIAVQNELRVKTSNAGIHFENISANSIHFETTNSGIKGTLPGRAEDYAITSHTSNGKNTLPESWNVANTSAKQLSVRTSNGSIKIFFE